MPQLSDLVEKRKFVKKEYRPWDLSGSGTVDAKEPSQQAIEVKAAPVVEQHLVSEPVAIITQQDVASHPMPVAVKEPKPHVATVSIKENLSPQITPSQLIQVTDNKTGNRTGNIRVTNRKQTDNIRITSQKQQDNNKVTIREQTDNVLDNITGNAEGLAYLIESIKKLSGIQKSIFLYVINVCSARGSLDTGNLISTDLANAANCSIGSAKTSLIRLLEKNLVLRLQGKASRGGHMVLGITKEIQSAAIQAQQALFNPYKMPQTDNNTGNRTDNMSPYSSSIYKNNITTSLPDDWKKINFECLLDIGFTETQLKQLHDSNMTVPEIVQDSINRFAYSLTHSEKVKVYSDPLNVLMGVLRKGQRWNEPNYISPKELALKQMLEEKRKQKEQHDAMVKELVELEFPEWRKKLTDEQIKQIVPSEILKMNISAATQSALRSYFLENILAPRFEEEQV